MIELFHDEPPVGVDLCCPECAGLLLKVGDCEYQCIDCDHTLEFDMYNAPTPVKAINYGYVRPEPQRIKDGKAQLAGLKYVIVNCEDNNYRLYCVD